MNKRSLRIGVTCYPTYGGSGIIASEIGLSMAERGHKVHFICYDFPRRLNRFTENVFFHEVVVNDYPVFIHPPYALALASKMVEVATYERLDVLHVHYAVPHATSAFLAKSVLGPSAPKVISTLHGTDITLVGTERSYLPITRFSIEQSDGVTTPSHFLKNATYDKLNVSTDFKIDVLYNFVDTEKFQPLVEKNLEERRKILGYCAGGAKLIAHASNFRPVKRLQDVIAIFAQLAKTIDVHLILMGDGPERSRIERLVHELKLSERVCFLGKLESVAAVFQQCDLFLLPSESEGAGLAALEAMSCGVPVIASNAGGIPEVVSDGESGFLFNVGDVASMSNAACQLLQDSELYRKVSIAARQRAIERFNRSALSQQYEDYYYQVMEKP